MSEFAAIQFDWETLKNTVPAEYLDYYAINSKDMNKVVGFGLLEENEPMATGIFYPYKNKKNAYTLLYLVVNPRHLREGLGSRLLSETFDYLSTKDVQKVFCPCFEDDFDVMKPFLEKAGFELTEKINLPVYGLDYHLIDKLSAGIKKALPQGEKVLNVSDLNKSELSKLHHLLQKTRALYSVNSINKDYSVVYTASDDIVAYLEADIVDDDFVKINDLFVRDSKYSKHAIPGMIAYLMDHAKKSLGEFGSVVVDLPKKSLARAVVNMFGAPSEAEDILVFKKDL